MVLSDMVCGCVRGCLECCGIFLFHVLYPEGGEHKGDRVGREGKLIMEWEFINSVTIQLAKIVFQNFLCKEIQIKNVKYDHILNQ